MDEELQVKIRQCIQDLGRLDAWFHKRAIKGLVEVGKPAVDPLIKALRDVNPDVRRNASIALAKIGEPAILPLFEILRTVEDNSRNVAFLGAVSQTLAGMGVVAVPKLIEIMQNPDEAKQMRWKAVKIIENIGRPAGPDLTEILKNKKENMWMRERAAEALGKIEYAEATNVLMDVLVNEKDGYLQEKAVRALGNIGRPAFETFTEAYTDGKILYEHADLFFRILDQRKMYGFDKGCVAPPKKKPDDLKRVFIRRQRKIVKPAGNGQQLARRLRNG